MHDGPQRLAARTPSELVPAFGVIEAYAVVFFANHQRFKQPHFIFSSIEHPAVTEPMHFLEGLGARVTRVPVDEYGLIDPDDIRRAIEHETVLISVMLAINEVGTIQPIDVIAAIARGREILFHTDAAQAVGKIPVDVELMGVDMLSIAGHKLYAPQGIGALCIQEGSSLSLSCMARGTKEADGYIKFRHACQIETSRLGEAEGGVDQDTAKYVVQFWLATRTQFC